MGNAKDTSIFLRLIRSEIKKLYRELGYSERKSSHKALWLFKKCKVNTRIALEEINGKPRTIIPPYYSAACEKMTYSNRRDALADIPEFNSIFSSYKCPKCLKYHLTTQLSKEQK